MAYKKDPRKDDEGENKRKRRRRKRLMNRERAVGGCVGREVQNQLARVKIIEQRRRGRWSNANKHELSSWT